LKNFKRQKLAVYFQHFAGIANIYAAILTTAIKIVSVKLDN